MAIAFRAVGTAKKVASGNLASIVLPTGHVANDILVCQFAAFDNVAATMTGWTQKSSVTNGTTAILQTYWKRDNGAESAPTITHAAGGVAIAQISAFSGVDSGLSDPFRDLQTQGATGTTSTGPALTGVVSGDMRGFSGMFSVADASGATTANWSTVAGWTERQEAAQIGASTAVSVDLDSLLATGSASSVTSTCNGSGFAGTITNIGCQFALSSAASGGATDQIAGASINATSAMSGSVAKTALVQAAAPNATSAVTASVAKLATVHGTVTATSNVTASVAKLATVKGSINATSVVTSALRALRAILPAGISSTSPVSGTLSKLGSKPISASVSATSNITILGTLVQALLNIEMDRASRDAGLGLGSMYEYGAYSTATSAERAEHSRVNAGIGLGAGSHTDFTNAAARTDESTTENNRVKDMAGIGGGSQANL